MIWTHVGFHNHMILSMKSNYSTKTILRLLKNQIHIYIYIYKVTMCALVDCVLLFFCYILKHCTIIVYVCCCANVMTYSNCAETNAITYSTYTEIHVYVATTLLIVHSVKTNIQTWTCISIAVSGCTGRTTASRPHIREFVNSWFEVKLYIHKFVYLLL
jgi:hypothetical protein